MDKYLILSAGFCTANSFRIPRYITGLFRNFSQSDYEICKDITVYSIEEAISKICELLNCKLISVTNGKNESGDIYFFYFFERYLKSE